MFRESQQGKDLFQLYTGAFMYSKAWMQSTDEGTASLLYDLFILVDVFKKALLPEFYICILSSV